MTTSKQRIRLSYHCTISYCLNVALS